MSLLVVGLSLAACGSSGPQVGDCSTADLDLGVDLFPEIVDCGDDKATSKLVSRATNKGDCNFARLEFEGKFFCVEAIDDEGNVIDSSPKVGDCTTGDPEAMMSFVKPVDCADKEAKSKISRKVESESECSKSELSTELSGNRYCLEGL